MSVHVLLTSFSDPVFDAMDFPYKLKSAMERFDVDVDLGIIKTPWISFQDKADHFNAAIAGNAYDWIIDISGGNLANGMLTWIDKEAFARSKTRIIGFSDLSSLLNTLAPVKPHGAFLCPIYYQTEEQMAEVAKFLKDENSRLTSWQYETSHSNFKIHHIYGGNLRCFLKLAGTPGFPDLTGCTLLLEGMGTSVYELMSLMAQLKQIGAFDQAENILFGVFSRIYLEPEPKSDDELHEFFSWVLEELEIDKPYAFTRNIGHIRNSSGVWLGKN